MSFFNTFSSFRFVQARFWLAGRLRQDVKPQADFNLVFELPLKKGSLSEPSI